MKIPKMQEVVSGISENDINFFRRETGLDLPQSYKDFLLVVDGGYLTEDNEYYYGVPEDFDSECVGITNFYSLIKGEEYETVLSNLACYKEMLMDELLSGVRFFWESNLYLY